MYVTIKGAETMKATQIRLFGIKIAQVRSYAPKLYSYMRKYRLKYLEHVLRREMSTTTAQKGSRAAGIRDGTKTYFYVCDV